MDICKFGVIIPITTRPLIGLTIGSTTFARIWCPTRLVPGSSSLPYVQAAYGAREATPGRRAEGSRWQHAA